VNKKPATKKGAGGRPRLGDEFLITTTIRLGASQKDKLERLGGAAWIRSKIDAAKDPAAVE